MKVKIIKCDYPNAWYNDKVGEIFECEDIQRVTDMYGNEIDIYYIKEYNGKFIHLNHGIPIAKDRENKFKRILHEC